MTVRPGSVVMVKTAFGDEIEKVATSEVMKGHDFPVVWVADVSDWTAAQLAGRDPEALPWPAEDVRVVKEPVA